VRKRFFLFFPTLFLFCFFSALSQIENDTAFVSAAIKNTKKIYAEVIKNQSILSNGSEYVDYVPLKDEHPYFINHDWIIGDIYYDGILHENVPLLYNTSNDNIIIEQGSSTIMIQLIKEKVGYFTMNGHKFVHLTDSDLPSGFYEQLNNGVATAYVKYTKVFLEELIWKRVTRNFNENVKYFVCKEKRCVVARNKSSMLKVLEDKKEDLNQFIRKNHFDFKKEKEKSILKLVEFYNTNPIKK
jgi:hypothetical protein